MLQAGTGPLEIHPYKRPEIHQNCSITLDHGFFKILVSHVNNIAYKRSPIVRQWPILCWMLGAVLVGLSLLSGQSVSSNGALFHELDLQSHA